MCICHRPYFFNKEVTCVYVIDLISLIKKQHVYMSSTLFLVFPAKYVALSRKRKDWFVRNQENVSEWDDIFTRGLLFQWLGIRLMCLSVTTCLPAVCCFSELALEKS